MAKYKVLDNQTGQIIEVDEAELGTYGLSTPSATSQMQAPQTTTQPVGQPSGQQTGMKFITGRSLEEHAQALQRAKMAGDKNAIKSITDDYDREFQYQNTFNKPDDKAKEKTSSQNEVSGVIQTVLDRFNTIPALTRGPLKSILGNIPGVAPEQKQYEKLRKGIATTLKEIVGESGVLTNQDVDRIVNLLPSPGATEKEIELNKQDLQKFLQAKGIANINVGDKPESTSPFQSFTENPLLNVLFGVSGRVGQDVEASVQSQKAQPQLQQKEQQAKALEDQAYATQDMQQRKMLLQQANQLRTGISQEAGDLGKRFSEDVNVNPMLRGVLSALEIVPAAKGAKALTKAVPKLFAKKAATEATESTLLQKIGIGAIKARTAAAKEAGKAGVTIGNEETKKAAKKIVTEKLSKLDPEYGELIQKLANQGLDPEEAVKLSVRAGQQTFTQSGHPKLTQLGGYYSLLDKALNKEIKSKIPKVAEQTANMARQFKLLDYLKKGAVIGGGIGSAAAGAGILYNVLKGRNPLDRQP